MTNFSHFLLVYVSFLCCWLCSGLLLNDGSVEEIRYVLEEREEEMESEEGNAIKLA